MFIDLYVFWTDDRNSFKLWHTENQMEIDLLQLELHRIV